MACCMLIVATVETQTPDLADGGKSRPVGISIVFLLFLFIFFYKPSWGAVTWIWSSEIFSMNVRAQGCGMAGQSQNIANAIVQQFFPTFLNNCGFYAFYSRSISVTYFRSNELFDTSCLKQRERDNITSRCLD